MKLSLITPEKAIQNRGYDKQSLSRLQIDQLQQGINRLFANIAENQNEEYHKNLISDLLKDVFYKDEYHVNVDKRYDLVIRTGKSSTSSVGVILEFKKPSNKAEMISADRPNVKALQELVLYYMRERVEHKNTDITHLIVTNVHEWFIFDEKYFDIHFAQNTLFRQEYTRWLSSGKNTDSFYKSIATPAIDAITEEIPCIHLRLTDYKQQTRDSEAQDRQLMVLYKILSPVMLLKLPVANDSNSLNKDFYQELLHLLGLEEYKESGKKTIRRKPAEKRHEGALLENTISLLQSRNKLVDVSDLEKYGDSEEEQLFGVGLELVITWLNRILFLKLLEAQLLNYHRGNPEYAFLNAKRIEDFDALNELFFDVLAVETAKRTSSVQKKYDLVPYLNSSLFELTLLERETFEISSLKDRYQLPLYSATVLKDHIGKRKLTGQKPTLSYLFEFLNAFDFSSEGNAQVRPENKGLINASVLGLIFEKINGYQEGAFYTPGFITMYMCRETIRAAVTRKFNEHYGWQCESFADLKDQVAAGNAAKRAEANQIINSIRCADIAVGSGHFLVSALNELLAIKSELEILSYQHDGSRVRTCWLRVESDELKVCDEAGQLVEYVAPTNDESLLSPRQRIQETIFHEKKTIIENCLFGVDINPNSVKICCLRLWIELLKHTYYQRTAKGNGFELKTLPNLDVNIKCGNSVISRFELDHTSNVLPKDRPVLRKLVQRYQDNVKLYKQGLESKTKLREEMNHVKLAIENLLVPNDKDYLTLQEAKAQSTEIVIATSAQEKNQWQLQREKLLKHIAEMEIEYEEKRRTLYRNAFEWRFEFPEVLDEEGNYRGFDVVIGNPPYIRQEELSKWKPYFQKHYATYAGAADLFVYFIEKGITLLQPSGNFSYIVANKWMRANYGKTLRQYLGKTRLTQLIDFGDLPVFEEASTYPCILSLQRSEPQSQFGASLVDTLNFEHGLAAYLTEKSFLMDASSLREEGWYLGKQVSNNLLDKLRKSGTRLGQYVKGKVYRGVLTGLNQAFVIDKTIKDRLIAEDPRSAEIIKPFLAGRDVKPYNSLPPGKYLLFLPKGWTYQRTKCKKEKENWLWLISNYPAIANHLLPFAEQARKRTDKGDFWWELRACDYYGEFEKSKIVYQKFQVKPCFIYDEQGLFCNDSMWMILGNDKVLLGILNSRLGWFLIASHCTPIQNGYQLIYKYLENIPIAVPTADLKARIEFLVNENINIRKENPKADTCLLEQEIDQLIYELYGLSAEEIQIVENSDFVKAIALPVSASLVTSDVAEDEL